MPDNALTTERALDGPRPVGGLLALAGVATFVVVVVALHFLQPGYDPSSQLMSELALGPYGAAMYAAFTGLALAVLGIQISIGPLGASMVLRALLVATAALFFAAGLFPLGSYSQTHIAAIAVAFVLAVLAMYLFPTMAGRASHLVPRLVSWGLAAGVAAGVALGHSVLPMGIGQRMAGACLLLWLAIAGWRVSRQ